LSDLADTATGTLAVVGRRSGVVIAASGLIFSAVAAPASAAPSTMAPAAASAVDTSTLTAAARAALDTSPVVSVPTNATWVLDDPVVKIVADPAPAPAPAAKPAPKPAPVAASHSATPAAAAAGAGAVPASANGSAVIEIASRYVGVPYVWGAATPSGMDCSGFTSYVYAQFGITLPHSSAAQRNSGTVVSRADALPGDLMVTPGHVAMYAGGDMLIDATPGKGVRFHTIYQTNPVFIRIA
jgi:cell wall-associated NlpC family hydrolase